MLEQDRYNLIGYSKCPNAYQMSKNGKCIPAGLMQYKLTSETVVGLTVDDKLADVVAVATMSPESPEYTDGFVLDENTPENLLRLVPDTRTGNQTDWTLVFVIKKTDEQGSICYKGALLDNTTGNFAIMTAINESAQTCYKEGMVKSHDPKYKICNCKMIAPLLFWDECKIRLCVCN